MCRFLVAGGVVSSCREPCISVMRDELEEAIDADADGVRGDAGDWRRRE